MAVRTLPVDGAAVVLSSSAGHRVLLASTDRISEQLEELVSTCGEGPALDAVTGGQPVLAPDLGSTASRARWPIFSNEALGIDTRAIFAAPLRIGAIGLGVFVTHRQQPGELDSGHVSNLLRLADAAAFGVLDGTELAPHNSSSAGIDGAAAANRAIDGNAHGAVRDEDEVDGNALGVDGDGWGYVSAEIHQASGMVMVQLGVPIATALARLRAHAFSNGRPLIDVARAVIARELIFNQSDDGIDIR